MKILKPNFILSIAGIVLLTIALLSFKTENAGSKYSYITIIARDHNCSEVMISIDGKEYSNSNLTKLSKGHWDMNPVLNEVHKFEDDGYELQNFTGDGSFSYFWLRKAK